VSKEKQEFARTGEIDATMATTEWGAPLNNKTKEG
jgi:hypothetical protein